MIKVKLGEVCKIVTGFTPKTNRDEFWNGNLKWITPAEINDYDFEITDTERTITKLGVEKTGLRPFPAGTVLLSSRAPIGKVAIAGTEMYCNQGFKNFICSDKIYNEFLYYFLKSKHNYLNSLGRGATFKEVSKSIVSNIEISLPPSYDNQKIKANILRRIDQIISIHYQQKSKLNDLVKSQLN